MVLLDLLVVVCYHLSAMVFCKATFSLPMLINQEALHGLVGKAAAEVVAIDLHVVMLDLLGLLDWKLMFRAPLGRFLS